MQSRSVNAAELRSRVAGAGQVIWAWLRAHPLIWSGAGLAAATAAFIAFESSMIPHMGFWVDELFSFWAGDPAISFAEAFSRRILPDTNGPIYFSLVYAVQATGVEGRAVFVVLNFISIASLLLLMIERGWRTGMLATAMSAVAIILMSGALLAYAPEGRVYGLSMAVSAVLAFYCGGAIGGKLAGRRELVLCAVFAVLAAWTHLFAAIFAGSLGVALIIVGRQLLRRRDMVVLGLTICVATVAAVAVWLVFAMPLFTGQTAWTTFGLRDVAFALWAFKHLTFGSTLAMVVALAFVGMSLLLRRSRTVTLVLVVSGGLFFVIPALISFKMPMFVGRYLLVAAPAMLVLMVFVFRAHLVDRLTGPVWRHLAPALGAMFFVTATTQGMTSAASSITTRPEWRGHEIVERSIDRCPAGEIRTLFAYPQQFGFEYYLRGRLKPVPAGGAPVRDVSTIDCPVYGWAEMYFDTALGLEWYKTADMSGVLKALNLTNTGNLPLEIVRHDGGLVLVRAR